MPLIWVKESFDWHESKVLWSIINNWVNSLQILSEKIRRKIIDKWFDLEKSIEWIEEKTFMDVNKVIQSVTWEVKQILWKSKNSIKESNKIWYLAYVSYIKRLLEKVWFSFEGKRVLNLDKNLLSELQDIFHDAGITSFFKVLLWVNILNLSDNITNEILKEREVKVMNANVDLFQTKLYDAHNTKKWTLIPEDECEVTDIYFDLPDYRLDDKSRPEGSKSLRFRIKKYKDRIEYFTTAKREKEGKEVRDCLEREFQVNDVEAYLKSLKEAWFIASRWKTKRRKSYTYITNFWKGKKKKFKFDIDFYDNIKPIIEVEWESKEDIRKVREYFGIQDGGTTSNIWETIESLSTGAREMFDKVDPKIGEWEERKNNWYKNQNMDKALSIFHEILPFTKNVFWELKKKPKSIKDEQEARMKDKKKH
jgi:adenylate cyclase class IV